jgi:hypothetical protein
VRHILAENLTDKQCSDLEASLVTEEVLKDPKCINLTLGGNGGFYGIHSSEEQSRKGSFPKPPMRKPITTPEGGVPDFP